jgi:hypothetical protein
MTATTYSDVRQDLEMACTSYQRDPSAENWRELRNKMTRAAHALKDLFVIAIICTKPPQPEDPEEVVGAVVDFLEIADEVGNFFLQNLPVDLYAPDDEDDSDEAAE